MRSASLFTVAVLAVVLAASLFSPVNAFEGISVGKATTDNDTTTQFEFTISGPMAIFPQTWSIPGASDTRFQSLIAGDYIVTENVPAGWVLMSVECVGTISTYPWSTFTYISNGVIVHFIAGDQVWCTFTNSPAPAVGGVVIPANMFAIVAPWLAVVGLVGCITVVIVKKRLA